MSPVKYFFLGAQEKGVVVNENLGDYILGLDLGPSSLGWAIIELDEQQLPQRIVRTGVRRFEAGVLGDIEAGRDESRATARRDARGPRRNTWRRQWRMRKLFRKLQHFGLFPPTADDSPDSRHHLMQQLDAELREQAAPEHNRIEGQLLPYRLRAMALDQPLARHAVGRAIYHLAQRRGFQSNRKANAEDEDTGVVKQGISELHGAIEQAECLTVGEYFATLDPEESRIRARWTSRRMFDHEFSLIWEAQAKHHASMTDEARQQVHEAIFFQRPLKSQKGLIGRCDLERDKRRAPLACLAAQRFRIWQRLNDLEVTSPEGLVRKLTLDEKKQLFAKLDSLEKLTWNQVKTTLGMKKSKEFGRHWVFNFEDGHKDLIGNRTAAKMGKSVDDAWTELTADRQEELIDEMISFESEVALARRLETGWELTSQQATQAAETRFEQDHARHSRLAIAKLSKLMEQGMPYSTARRELYGERFESTAAYETLPPVRATGHNGEGAFPVLRNPAVERAMSELRKVVNAIIRETGKKPTTIRVELARDLKHARNRREQMSKRRDDNTKARESAAAKILNDLGEQYITRDNILKVRLAEECNWACPFTGKSISMKALVGKEPQFDIEHIIPFSRSLDNSYLNKTICHHEENRNVKRNQIPWEAYSTTEQYEQILQRVRRFKGDARARKLTLFEIEKLPDTEEFTQKQLSDTRYLSRMATQYLALLYGGKTDEGRTLRVQVLPGRATSYLRQRWDLNGIIGHADNKNRADHRHHAIDAIVVALTTPRAVKVLCEAAEEAEERGDPKLFADVENPWDDFLDEAHESIQSIAVSSRVSKKLNGSLHKETILSKPHTSIDKQGKPVEIHHVRKPLANMSAGEVEAIVDNRVRELVQQALHAHKGPPAQVFKDPANHPHLISKKDPSRVIPIHAARIRKPDNPMAVGSGSNRRFVNPGSNHHMEIVAVLDKHGKEKKWEGIIVNQFDAVQRKRRGEPVIQCDHGEGRKFKFSLAIGEHVMIRNGETMQLVRTLSTSEREIEFICHTDARPSTIRRQKGGRIRCPPDGLRKRAVKKVVVSPLGNISPAND